MERFVPAPDADRDELPLEARLVQVLEAAHAAVTVDRLHLWALAPDGERLLYVAGSGLRAEDRLSSERPEMRLADAGAIGKAIRQRGATLVNGRSSPK